MATEGVSTKASTWSAPVTASTTMLPTAAGNNNRLTACVRLPDWPTDRRKRRERPGNNSPPLALTRTTANRQLVVAACAKARGAGVRPGMTLAQARAICPAITHADHDPAGDTRALEGLARWMMRFTPFVQCVDAGDGNPQAGLFLDVTGTGRLFGSLDHLARQIVERLAQLRLPARLAIAPTPGAAWALTHVQSPRPAVVSADVADALAPLSVGALRLDEATLQTLHHLGLHTVGQVLALPRDTLPARFGPLLLTRVDQALGRLAEPLTPLPYHAPIEASTDFDGVVDSLETLWDAFGKLIAQVTDHLVRRGLGARQLAVTFRRPYATSIERTIDLSGPSRNPAVLFNLIRCTMETVGQTRATKRRSDGATKGKKTKQVFSLRRCVALSLRRYEHFEPSGFVGLRLAVPVFERLTEEQIFLLDPEQHAGRAELDRLVERLRIRLGREALVGVDTVESYVPERAYRERGQSLEVRGQEEEGEARGVPRPLHLFTTPREIRVMVRPSDDRDGAPVSFTLDGEVHRLVHAVGPERIGGAWWTGHDKTRDYFDVEDESARRWWVFRVFENGRWFVHGKFE